MNIMKNFYKLMIMVAAVWAATPLFTSCSDDEEETNEYTTSYVYLQRTDYLESEKIFTITHNSITGLGGEVSMPFRLKVQRTSSEDITVNLAVQTSEGLEGKIELSSQQVIIKAGEMQSEELMATIPDLSFMSEMDEAVKYTFTVIMESVQTSGKSVKMSSVYNALPATVNKEALSVDNLKNGQPDNSVLDNRSEWAITLMPGVENTAANLIDGDTWSDVAINNSGFWIALDLGSEKTVTGIKTQHWAGAYAPSKIELYISEDGSQWQSMGNLNTGDAAQYISFKVPVNTRYLKYDILVYPGRVDVTEFNVYISK